MAVLGSLMVRRHNLAMPSKKKKYNARFPAGRIKKIMQTDEDVGKVAQAVPIIISRTLELFVESLLTKSVEITSKRNAKTLSPSHMKQCILAEARFDFLRDLVKNIPDASHVEDRELGQTVSADSSPNSNRFSDSGNASVNPGPSNAVKRPKRLQKKDNGQSSDSGSDHEPAMKRLAMKTYGNGKNPPKTNFDEELKAFKQRMNHRQGQSPRISPKKNTNEAENKDFVVPNDVNIPFASGECSSNNTNRQRLFNFYTETLPDTSEDDEKEKRNKAPAYGSVIQANPEYSVPTSFGFYKPTSSNQPPRIVENNSFDLSQPATSKSRINSDSCVPKLHIDLSQGFMSPTVSVLPNDATGPTPMYHIDLSAMPIPRVDNEHPYTPTILCPPQTSVISAQRVFSSPAAKKAPPPLQTINLRRSASMPESNNISFARPSSDSMPRTNCPSRPEPKSRIEHSSLPSARKNEPPLLLPINLVQKSVIASPSSTVIPVHTPTMEIDEDYDT